MASLEMCYPALNRFCPNPDSVVSGLVVASSIEKSVISVDLPGECFGVPFFFVHICLTR